MSKSPQFFLEYIEDGIVDWDYALDARENIRNKYEKLLKEGSITKEEFEKYENRKINYLQQAVEKLSKGLLLIYAGIILLPFMIVAEMSNFGIKHPREMQEIINNARNHIKKSVSLNEIEKLGHEPIKESNLKELLELTQRNYRRYLGNEGIAKCLKSVENFITSSIKNRKWETLWEIVKKCEKLFNLSQLMKENLQLFVKCINNDKESCRKLNLSDAVLDQLAKNPYIINFSFAMTEMSIKEFIDMSILASYLEPLSTITRYSISSNPAYITRKELLEDVREHQDDIISFLEMKVQIVKNLVKNDEFVENMSKLYEVFGKILQNP
ncbi:hypothetical protein [Acidianus brierleyi]|uniref:Uncharacterized protein n=1 Tax=Acidianus brierleyi TaxID=41673 RepID=A0A2U9IDD1_9CREN|nr:hypothetical protein [Acidianus brierleyi]AWR94025.1 hypothetical protein DFR85_04800 [Acidianus brierleyi]